MITAETLTPQANGLVTVPARTPVPTLSELLARVRPAWQVKSLMERVTRILPVDPSSACQRLLNAALHDLREKIVIGGIDITAEAADLHKLPPVRRADDILDNYSPTNVLESAYRTGILSRPEWKCLVRAYDIRGDLEHEDDEYEARVNDNTP